MTSVLGRASSKRARWELNSEEICLLFYQMLLRKKGLVWCGVEHP